MATIKGTRFADALNGTTSIDTILGLQGDDFLTGATDLDLLRGGRGNDDLTSLGFGLSYGGVGNDTLDGHGMMAGGPGNDRLFGDGRLYGDQGEGERASAKGGADTLGTFMYFDTGAVTQTGGAGADTFIASGHVDGVASSVTVTDFHLGDKVGVLLAYTDGPFENGGLDQATVFSVLSGGDGVVDDYAQADGNAAVWSDVEGERLVIRLHEDYVVVNFDAGQAPVLTASDWAFDY